jgi:hypothetical protein
MQQQFFSFESELKNNDQTPSSHCSSVQERLASYGSEALDTTEHLALILGSQQDVNAILHHFGSLSLLARASVQELCAFTSRNKAVWHPAGWFLDHAGWAGQQHVNLFACVGESRRTRGEMERVYC